MKNPRIANLIDYINEKHSVNQNIRPKTALHYFRTTYPGVAFHYNRFAKRFIFVTREEVYQFPIQLPFDYKQFRHILFNCVFLNMSHTTTTPATITLDTVAKKECGETMRVDATCANPVISRVDVTPPNTHADNVSMIYEEAAAEMLELMKELATPEELAIFDEQYQSISAAHIHRDYKDVDRNVYDREAFSAGNLKKISAGIYTERSALHEQVWVPAFILGVHAQQPRDESGFPMIITPPKNLDNLESLLCASVKNTSPGHPLHTVVGSITKQQLVIDAAIAAQNILNQLKDDKQPVLILPATASGKNENTKKKKSRRYFFMESIVFNFINQLLFGHILDNQHQIPLSGFYDGLSTDIGIGRASAQRMLHGLGIDVNDLEKYITNALTCGATIEQITEDLSHYLLTATSDFTNFEFYHNVMCSMIDFFSNVYYCTPGDDDELFLKTLAFIYENAAINEISVGEGWVLRVAAMSMASGQFRTLVGNTGRNRTYKEVALLYTLFLSQFPSDPKERLLVLNALRNAILQGDDSWLIFLTRHLLYITKYFENMHNFCCVKIKPEIRRLLSNHTDSLVNIMTNGAGDFLKSSLVYDPVSGKLVFSRPYQSFLLRMLAPNGYNVKPAKLLQIARSFALSSGLCNMATLHAKKLFDKAFEYLRVNDLLQPGLSDKELFVDSTTYSYRTNEDTSLDDTELQKEAFKHVINPNDDHRSANIISFPTSEEIENRYRVDDNFLARLAIVDSYYAVHRLSYDVALRYLIDSNDSSLAYKF